MSIKTHTLISKHFTLEELVSCSDTKQTQNIENYPKQIASIDALLEIAVNILDPIVDKFGPITLTYGFCSPELARVIKKNENPHIAPNLDQHASHELNAKGNFICPRLGAAVDFFIDAMPDQMDEVAQWIAENLKFDRMYYYGKSRPLHISYGPDMNQFVQLMVSNSNTGRRTPGKRGAANKAKTILKQLDF